MEVVLEEVENQAELYNKLLKEKENGKIFTKDDITKDILYELCINEDVIDAQICDLFNITRNQIRYIRKKYGMQNIFLLKMLGNEYKEEAYAKIKEINPEVNISNFNKTYYNSIYLYGKSKGWNEEFMNKTIPKIPQDLEWRDSFDKEKSDTLDSQDYTITVTAREHIGNKEVKSRNASGGRRTNQIKLNIARVKSGKFGEKLVVKNYEENKLRKLGIEKRVIWCTETDEPDVTYDGLGYDVISYNEKHEKIYS